MTELSRVTKILKLEEVSIFSIRATKIHKKDFMGLVRTIGDTRHQVKLYPWFLSEINQRKKQTCACFFNRDNPFVNTLY